MAILILLHPCLMTMMTLFMTSLIALTDAWLDDDLNVQNIAQHETITTM